MITHDFIRTVHGHDITVTSDGETVEPRAQLRVMNNHSGHLECVELSLRQAMKLRDSLDDFVRWVK